MQSVIMLSVISSLIIESKNKDCDGPDMCREAKTHYTTGSAGAEPNRGEKTFGRM